METSEKVKIGDIVCFKHTDEAGNIAYFKSNHANQKNFIASKVVGATIKNMLAIQRKHGITEETVNPFTAFALAFKTGGLDVTADTFNRAKIKETQPVVEAVADTSSITDSYIKEVKHKLELAQKTSDTKIDNKIIKNYIENIAKVPQQLIETVFNAVKIKEVITETLNVDLFGNAI